MYTIPCFLFRRHVCHRIVIHIVLKCEIFVLGVEQCSEYMWLLIRTIGLGSQRAMRDCLLWIFFVTSLTEIRNVSPLAQKQWPLVK